VVTETLWWEAAVLRNVPGRAALYGLCRIAGIDPGLTREAWASPETKARVHAQRRLLFAHVRRMRHRRQDDRTNAVVYEVLAWMLLVTECPFSAHHRQELIAAIAHDPACRLISRLRRMPASDVSRVRAEALLLLLTDLRNYDTSAYVSDHPRGLRGWWQRWFGAGKDKSLQPFLRTELPAKIAG